MGENPNFGKWESFRVRRVALVNYVPDKKRDLPKGENKKVSLVMYGPKGHVWSWYPVKGDGLLDCKLLSRFEADSIELCTGGEVEFLKSFWHEDKTKPLTSGMHQELVRKWKRTVRKFIKVQSSAPVEQT